MAGHSKGWISCREHSLPSTQRSRLNDSQVYGSGGRVLCKQAENNFEKMVSDSPCSSLGPWGFLIGNSNGMGSTSFTTGKSVPMKFNWTFYILHWILTSSLTHLLSLSAGFRLLWRPLLCGPNNTPGQLGSFYSLPWGHAGGTCSGILDVQGWTQVDHDHTYCAFLTWLGLHPPGWFSIPSLYGKVSEQWK